MQACKPGSVLPTSREPLSFICPPAGGSISLPAPIPISREEWTIHFYRSLFDLSTRKVYHAPFITVGTVGSYPTFSLSPQSERIGSWLLIFCGTFCQFRVPAGRPLLFTRYVARCCPDFPPRQSRGDKAACMLQK
jgi:hypothetical protein